MENSDLFIVLAVAVNVAAFPFLQTFLE